jgi:hypothetical protein
MGTYSRKTRLQNEGRKGNCSQQVISAYNFVELQLKTLANAVPDVQKKDAIQFSVQTALLIHII